MQEFVYYLSPIFALIIFAAIVVFIKIKKKQIRIVGYDYLWLNNLQSKIRAKFRKLNLASKVKTFEKLLYNLYEKFVRKVKIEALKIQVWADKKLERHKQRRDRQMTNGE
jgi:hypothetical protein